MSRLPPQDGFDEFIGRAMRARPEKAATPDLAGRAIEIARRRQAAGSRLRRRVRRWTMGANAVAGVLVAALAIQGVALMFGLEPLGMLQGVLGWFTALLQESGSTIDADLLTTSGVAVLVGAAAGAALVGAMSWPRRITLPE